MKLSKKLLEEAFQRAYGENQELRHQIQHLVKIILMSEKLIGGKEELKSQYEEAIVNIKFYYGIIDEQTTEKTTSNS